MSKQEDLNRLPALIEQYNRLRKALSQDIENRMLDSKAIEDYNETGYTILGMLSGLADYIERDLDSIANQVFHAESQGAIYTDNAITDDITE